MSPTVSVIIPHYNRATLLADSLASVRAQSRPPDEILIVDDASRADERRALDRWAPIARILDRPVNGGAAAARNTGIAAATGEWIAFQDSDDLWAPHKLETQLRHLAEHPGCEGVHSAIRSFFADGSERVSDPLPARLTLADALRINVIRVQSLLVRADALRSLGGFDESLRMCEDDDLGIRLALAGTRIDFLDEPLVRMRRQGHGHLFSRWQDIVRWKTRVAIKHRRTLERELGRGATRRRVANAVRKAGHHAGGPGGRALRAIGYVLGGFHSDVE